MSECLNNSIFMYIVIMIALYVTKPSFLFYTNTENKCLFKTFGCGENKSIFSIQIIAILLSILVYFFTYLILKLEK